MNTIHNFDVSDRRFRLHIVHCNLANVQLFVYDLDKSLAYPFLIFEDNVTLDIFIYYLDKLMISMTHRNQAIEIYKERCINNVTE